ncbi:hypothetical protein GCM10027289_27210 [Tsukamurella serpentis]
MTKMKKLIGSALLGAAVLGGVGSVGAGIASADPGRTGVTQDDHRGDGRERPVGDRTADRDRARTNGENPNWRPGPVYRQGAWHTPVWDEGRNHWGFWLGPIWIPVG